MIGTKLGESYLFKVSMKIRSLAVYIDIKVMSSKVSITIGPGRSLLQFVTTNCLIKRTRKLLMLLRIYLENRKPKKLQIDKCKEFVIKNFQVLFMSNKILWFLSESE